MSRNPARWMFGLTFASSLVRNHTTTKMLHVCGNSRIPHNCWMESKLQQTQDSVGWTFKPGLDICDSNTSSKNTWLQLISSFHWTCNVTLRLIMCLFWYLHFCCFWLYLLSQTAGTIDFPHTTPALVYIPLAVVVLQTTCNSVLISTQSLDNLVLQYFTGIPTCLHLGCQYQPNDVYPFSCHFEQQCLVLWNLRFYQDSLGSCCTIASQVEDYSDS